MLSHVVLFFVLISVGVLCCVFSRNSFEETLPLSCSGIVVLLYICGMFGRLQQGVLMVCICSLIFYVASVTTIVKKRDCKRFCKQFFTPGFFFFCLLFVGLTVVHFGRMATGWDEFSHWADVVKAMVIIDDFSTNPLSASRFQSYMPGMPLFQYFVQELHQFVAHEANFCEWRLYFAYQLFAYSFFFPFLKNVQYKKFFSGLLLFGAICLSPMILFGDLFPTTVYIDPFVGMVAGSGFALLYVNRKKNRTTYITLLSVLTVLVLAKDVGLLFAIFLAIAIVIDKALSLYQKHEKTSLAIRDIAMLLIGVAVAVFLPKALWNYNINSHNAVRMFNEPIDIAQLMEVLRGTDNTYRTVVLNNYIQFFTTGVRLMGLFEWNISYPLLLSLLTFGLFVLHWAFSKGTTKEQKPHGLIIGMVLIQTCFYIVGLCVLYMFRFSEYEGVILASADRYLCIAFLTMQIMLVLILYSLLQRKVVLWYPAGLVLLSLILILLPNNKVRMIFDRTSVNTSIEARAPYEELSTHIHELSQDEHKKVYIISQGSGGYDYWVLKYSIRPCKSNESFTWSLSTEGALYEGDMSTIQKSPDDWMKELQTYDYVLLHRVDETFLRDYAHLFAEPAEIKDYAIYEVDHQAELLRRCQ